MTSPSGDHVIKKISHIAYYTFQTIIFKTWGLKLLYLLWFKSYKNHKIVHFLDFSAQKHVHFVARYLVTESSNQFFKCAI